MTNPRLTFFVWVSAVLCVTVLPAELNSPGSEFSGQFRPRPEYGSEVTLQPAPPAELTSLPSVDEHLARRLAELEAEQETLRAEVEWLREHPVRLPETKAVSTGLQGGAPVSESAEEEQEFFTLGELQEEMKKLAWTKGDFRVVPYGSLWGSAIYATERTFPGPYTLYVVSPDVEGEDTFVIDTRRTRLGLDVAGPRIPLFANAVGAGRVEIDFHGAFVVENKPGVLLRHAYGEVKNERFRLLAGQTSDVISPLYPGTINYSVGWAGGNIGYRRAQVRLERYLVLSDRHMVTLEGSVNQNIISDFTGTAGVRPEPSGWPVLEGRCGFTLGHRGQGYRPITFGVSGHIGEQGFDFLEPGPPPLNFAPRDDVRLRTWSFNVDARVPIGERMGVQGEFFTGQNLGTFLGGVAQGVCLCRQNTIRSTGGWFDVWYDWTPCLHSHAGYGIDDPFDSDLIQGRSYNHFLFANATVDISKNLSVGLEVSSWKTLFIDRRPGDNTPRPGDSVHFEFSGKYEF